MKGKTHNRVRRLEQADTHDPIPWSMTRISGVLTGPHGQTMTGAEYLRRKAEGLPLPMVWDDDEPQEAA